MLKKLNERPEMINLKILRNFYVFDAVFSRFEPNYILYIYVDTISTTAISDPERLGHFDRNGLVCSAESSSSFLMV